MMRNIIMDLDGTLTQSGIGIQNSVRYALAQLGLPPQSEQELNRFVGPPLQLSFMEYCGLNEQEAKKAITLYREYFVNKGMFENQVYPGIPSLLQALRERGNRLFIATGKPTVYADEILSHFGLRAYFEEISGVSLDETNREKDFLIGRLLSQFSLEPDCTVMVGDRRYDMQGAAALGVLPVGVLYGYGDREELTAAGAVHLAETVEQLQDILLKADGN